MTRATSDGLSESRKPILCRVCSSDGFHERVGNELFDSVIRALPIRAANSVPKRAILF